MASRQKKAAAQTQAAEEGAADPIGTLSRGLHVLRCIASHRGAMGLAPLAAASGLNRATAHRLASTLVRLGYLERCEGEFRLTPQVLELGFSYLASLDVRSQALAELRMLRDELDCSIGLCVLAGHEAVYVEHFDPINRRPSVRTVVGDRLPLHSTASGKALLAFLPVQERNALLKRIRYEHHTPYTLKDRTALERDLALTARRGFAISNQEHIADYRSVAAPVLDRAGRPVAAILAGAVVARFGALKELREDVGPRLVAAARTVSERLAGGRYLNN